ncbi:phosphonate utilization associated transcriptional regulator [compost metagenome]
MRALDSGGGLRVSADEHSHIVDAIASGNADTAGRALRTHVADSRARMHKAFGRIDGDAAAISNTPVTPNHPPQKEV